MIEEQEIELAQEEQPEVGYIDLPDYPDMIDLTKVDSDDVKEAIYQDLEEGPIDTALDEYLENMFNPKIQVRLKPLVSDDNFKLPWKATPGSACFDVHATEINIIEDQDYVNSEGDVQAFPSLIEVKLGFATSIPKDYKGIIVPRSSFTHTGWIMQNSPAQIDSDYRGEWTIKFRSLGTQSIFPINVGDRVAQVYFEKVVPVQLYIVSELDKTERGEGGYGSTDNKTNNESITEITEDSIRL
jgi:dUTPase